jgi:hypothetical protein
MDYSNLQQVLELFKTLGADAKQAFIWWLVCDTIAKPMVTFLGIGWLLWVCRQLWRYIHKEGE